MSLHLPKEISKYFTLLFVFLYCFCIGQSKDSSEVHKDSLHIYKKIKKLAYKHKVTRWAYDAVFVDPEPKEYPTQPVTEESKNVNPYLNYEGTFIRKITVTVHDPFGFNVNDTIRRPINTSQKVGNRLHITTRQFIILNRLLFKQNDTVNGLKFSESERILRQALFINDARIFIEPTQNKDSVDVNVVVLDRWSLDVPLIVTDQYANVNFRNKNLFGSGQQFEQSAGYKRSGERDYRGSYSLSNIANTFISAQLGYNSNSSQTNAFLNLDKPFYSFFATWAGGISVNHTWTDFIWSDTIENISKKIPVCILGYDVWAAKNFKLAKRKTLFNQSMSLIVGARYFATDYLNRPNFSIDTGRTNINASAWLGNVGFAVQQYYKDKYIYRFGANEDVPEGLIAQYTYGILKEEGYKLRYYSGIEIGRAKHFDRFGYLTATFSYGVFYNVKVPNDVTTVYKLYYFSDLIRGGQWFFRQFINFNWVHGENKILNNKITLNSSDLYGFSQQSLKGNTKLVLNAETVTYLPYSLIGFKFAPVVMVGLGMIGDKEHPVVQSRLYQGYSLGLMIRNENLIVNTFQISIGVYPFLPDTPGPSFVYNPVTSFSFRVRLFSVSKPDFIAY
jgi:hypothetical protein